MVRSDKQGIYNAKGNMVWIVIFALLCAVCAAIWIMRGRADTGAATAVIKQNGEVIRTIDLSGIEEPLEFEVRDENGGYNIIRAEHGRIAVIEADCPDKICVNQGYIENDAVPIVCLPHKLSITLTDADSEIDAVAGGN